jgi:glycopeptide antibiotics resistance protein
VNNTTAVPADRSVGGYLRRLWPYLALCLGLALLLTLAARSQLVPYNIRELLGGGDSFARSLGLVLALGLAFGPPAAFGIALLRRPLRDVWRFPLGIVLQSALVYLGLRIAVPLESIHDILGTPVLGWPPELERLARFGALFGVVSLLLAGGAVIFHALVRAPYPSVLLRWLVMAVLLLPLGHWVVVQAAATDNLVELLRGGGGWLASLSLGAWFVLLGLGGSILAARSAGAGQGWFGTLLGVLLLTPLGYGLVLLGTEPAIDKYGERFSALQFLLSPDRSDYVSDEALALRYVLIYLALLGMVAFAQYPVWRWWAGGLTSHRPRMERGDDSFAPSPAAIRPTGGRAPPTWVLAVATIYLLFVVYGSLVPFDVQPIPLAQALEGFFSMPYLPLGVGRAGTDLPTNVLLYIPLSFLFAELLLRNARGAVRWLGMLSVLLLAQSLSLLIEFVQQFFPARATSLRDVLANGAGAAAGLLLWRWRGEALSRWVGGWRVVSGRAGVAEYLLWGYLGLLFFYNLLPLDLTISPVEIYHKWSRGDLNLIPFGYGAENTAQLIYELGTDIAIWVPVSLLWILSGKKGPMPAWGWSILAALALEFGQLLVFSRVSDVTDVITAAIGGGIGVSLARFFVAGAPMRRAAPRTALGGAPVVAGLAMLWVGVLAAVFWYPYHFEFSRVLLHERMALFYQTPFQDYFYGTEFRAVTGVLRQLALYLPLGLILGRLGRDMRRGAIGALYLPLAMAALLLVPLGIELGQVALPGKFPSSGDWLLAFLAGLGGYFSYRAIQRRVPRFSGGPGSTLAEQGRDAAAQ